MDQDQAERLRLLEEETKKRLAKLQGGEQGAELHEFSQSSKEAQQRQQELRETIEKRKRARELAVPTNDNDVKLKLREYSEPICLFGEGPPERRERLRDIMAANLDLDASLPEMRGGQMLDTRRITARKTGALTTKEDKKELFYTEGGEALKQARAFIANYSLTAASARLATERARVSWQCENVAAYETEQRKLSLDLRGVQNQLSNFADERAVSYVNFSPGSTICATGSWSAIIKLWSIPDCRCIGTLRGHTERISGLSWHPSACSTQSKTAVNLASSSCDNTAKLWGLEGGAPLGELKGHLARLSRVAFHPSGRMVGTASFDTSWRLWDAETCQELLLQEGHTRALYAIAFHPDGSLCATAGLDAIIRLWDLRTGRSVQTLQGHVKQILGLDFSPTGSKLASGSDDHTVRLWDLRKKKAQYTIPAHSSLISHVKFQPKHGNFIASSSYDNKVKLWSMRDYSLLKTMEGHEGRVMSVDVSDDGKYFATSAMDRTWKLWGQS